MSAAEPRASSHAAAAAAAAADHFRPTRSAILYESKMPNLRSLRIESSNAIPCRTYSYVKGLFMLHAELKS